MLLNAASVRLFLGRRGQSYARVGSEKAETQWYWPIPRAVQMTLGLVALGLLSIGSFFFAIPKWRSSTPFRHREAYHQTAEKHLVIASYTAQNVSWLAEIPSSWTIKRYVLDEPKPEPPDLAVPLNQGREAMAYLTYIIDHYDNLPEYVVFVHGHERSWHQQARLQQKVRALNLTALDEEDYVSLRCGVQMGCEKQPYIDTHHVNWSGEDRMCDFWQTITGERCPRYVSYKCCAQHAVTRHAVRKRSKKAWIRIREPIMHEQLDNWLSGMYYEKFWHMLLGAGPEYCPSAERCQQVHFSNAIICDGDTDATVFEGDAWMDVQCVSAFDGLDRDAQAGPAIQQFHSELLDVIAKVRGQAGERHKEQQDALRLAEVVGTAAPS